MAARTKVVTNPEPYQAKLTKLEQRRAQLAESLDAVTHNAISASTLRRELIIANRDQQDLEEANARVRTAEEQRVALDDALRTLDQQVSALTTRLSEAKDKAERERVAVILENEAHEVQKASEALDKSVKQFASAYQQLRSVMSPASCLRTPAAWLREEEVTRVIAAEALAGKVPTLFCEENGEVGVIAVLRRRFATRDGAVLFEARDKKQWANAAGAQKHAELLITKRLRANAAAIRFGDEPAVLPPARPEPNRNYYKHPAERHVLFLRPVRYTRGGRPVLCNAWTTRVPVPVADAAIKQGLALLADTDEAREKMREMSERRRRIPQRLGPAVTIEDTVDLVWT